MLVTYIQFELFYFVAEVLVKIQLFDVLYSTAGKSFVKEDGGLGCGHKMDMCCAPGIVVWEEGVELDNAIGVGSWAPRP